MHPVGNLTFFTKTLFNMKLLKIAFATLLLTLFASDAFSQFSIGARGGIHIADYAISGADGFGTNPESRLGPLVGVVSEIRFSDNFAIQPELNFLQKGASQDIQFSDSLFGGLRVEAEVFVNYLELPVLLKVGSSFSTLRVDALVGPGFGYAMSGKTKGTITTNGVPESEEESIDFDEDGFSRTDFSLHFGGMLTFQAGGAAKIFVDGRYILGLTNLNTSDSDTETRNRGVSFSAGVLVGL